MGIKHLSSWLMRTLPQDAIKPISVLNPVHTLAIDLNDLLHRAMNQAKDRENRFYTRVISMLRQLIETTQPQHSVGIFMDGVAPAAKFLLQIKRRRSSPPDSMQTAPLFSSLAITPGTPAMRLLADAIRSKICDGRRHVYFSCSDEPGEGEVKMVKWLKSIPRHAGENVLVFGADADLISIGCMQQRLHSSRICLDMHQYQTAPVHGFGQFLRGENDSEMGRMEDVAILLMMLGNDYLPKLSGFSPDLALQAYRAVGFPRFVNFDENGTLSLSRDAIAKLFDHLCQQASDCPAPELSNSEDDDIRSAVKAFFEGIAWMATMYYTGECPDFSFRLQRASATITIPRCLQWLNTCSPERIRSPVSNEAPMDVDLAQLLMTPLWGQAMVQPHLRHIMDPDAELGYFFHHPCHICAGYRSVIRAFPDSGTVDNSAEAAEFRRNISIEHALHIQESHASIWNSPPIAKLRSRLDLDRKVGKR